MEQLRRQLAEARAQADRSDKKAEELRQQLAAAEDLICQQTLAAEEMAAHLEAVQAQAREAHIRLTEATAAHAAELEQVRADAQARSAGDARADRDEPADQGTLVSRDVLASHDISASRDAPAGQDASAVPDPEREVTVVSGVPRYHTARCLLIRFMGEGDVDTMTIDAARQADCAPCCACLPDQLVQEAQLSVNGLSRW